MTYKRVNNMLYIFSTFPNKKKNLPVENAQGTREYASNKIESREFRKKL